MVKREIITEFAYPEDQITVIYNGLPDVHFKRKPGTRLDMRHDWGLRENDIALLFAGSGWERKGLKYAIQAISRIANRNVRLLVAGKGKKPAFSLEEGKIPGTGHRYAIALRCGRFVCFAHGIRPVFKCVPGGSFLRNAGYHNRNKWVCRDHRARRSWSGDQSSR